MIPGVILNIKINLYEKNIYNTKAPMPVFQYKLLKLGSYIFIPKTGSNLKIKYVNTFSFFYIH